VVIFVAAAVLTPPDVISQIMLAVPILILYEISIWICKSVTKKREQEMELNDAAVNEA
jgi:sec-independent protein translocase protein TatC